MDGAPSFAPDAPGLRRASGRRIGWKEMPVAGNSEGFGFRIEKVDSGGGRGILSGVAVCT